jgi:hypothetical protein
MIPELPRLDAGDGVDGRPLTAWGPDIGIGIAMKPRRDCCDEGAAKALSSCDEATKVTAPKRESLRAGAAGGNACYTRPDVNQDITSSTW